MKKFRCPHCGEFSFNFFHKTIRKDGRVGRFFRDNLYFVCGKCGKPVEHKASKYTKKICSLLIPLVLILLVLFMVLAILKQFNLMLLVYAIVVLLSFSISSVGYKYDVIIREQGSYDPSKDIYIDAHIQIHKHINSVVFKLTPIESELHKVAVQREYIAELTDYEVHKDNCKIRIIKPIDTIIPEGIRFNIIDNGKIIGIGRTLIQGKEETK